MLHLGRFFFGALCENEKRCACSDRWVNGCASDCARPPLPPLTLSLFTTTARYERDRRFSVCGNPIHFENYSEIPCACALWINKSQKLIRRILNLKSRVNKCMQDATVAAKKQQSTNNWIEKNGDATRARPRTHLLLLILSLYLSMHFHAARERANKRRSFEKSRATHFRCGCCVSVSHFAMAKINFGFCTNMQSICGL